MTVSDFLVSNTRLLYRAGIATARLDCLVLLEHVLSTDRTHILSYSENELTREQEQALTAMIQRRAEHEPLAYIRQQVEFYGRMFFVNTHVLVPRPETEALIDMLIHLVLPTTLTIVDIGTGSGALAVTAALQLPHARVIGTDIDPACLRVAARNARTHHVNVEFMEGDLTVPLAPLQGCPDVLLCNLPYVPDDYIINKAAAHEPHRALFAGRDGLDIYRKLFGGLERAALTPSFVLTESLPAQHSTLATIGRDAGYGLQTTQDFAQLFTRG